MVFSSHRNHLLATEEWLVIILLVPDRTKHFLLKCDWHLFSLSRCCCFRTERFWSDGNSGRLILLLCFSMSLSSRRLVGWQYITLFCWYAHVVIVTKHFRFKFLITVDSLQCSSMRSFIKLKISRGEVLPACLSSWSYGCASPCISAATSSGHLDGHHVGTVCTRCLSIARKSFTSCGLEVMPELEWI